MRILLLEDDRILGEALRDFMRTEDHVVEWCCRLSEARTAYQHQPYDALVIDWQLPDGSGLAWLRSLREGHDSTPALMITARDQLSDRLSGLNTGADDYLVKPFEPEELLARLRAVRRRTAGSPAPVIRLGPVTLDLNAKTAHLSGQPVALTAREWALLEALVLRKGRTVPKSELEDLAMGFDGSLSDNALEVHISAIRRKLGKDIIQTLRGLGYRVNT
ncbi:MAG: response regulator transcription factor [Burkholderiales bacterium]|jgi:two-component system OmpR family response regulator|nr:response regulator transcription factor [Burkholderiales bacterium]